MEEEGRERKKKKKRRGKERKKRRGTYTGRCEGRKSWGGGGSPLVMTAIVSVAKKPECLAAICERLHAKHRARTAIGLGREAGAGNWVKEPKWRFEWQKSY